VGENIKTNMNTHTKINTRITLLKNKIKRIEIKKPICLIPDRPVVKTQIAFIDRLFRDCLVKRLITTTEAVYIITNSMYTEGLKIYTKDRLTKELYNIADEFGITR